MSHAVQFPSRFLWGAATASYQVEGATRDGGRGESVWDVFSHTDGKVAHGHTGDVASDHYHRLDDDVAMMADLGLQSYRFSISWSRVLPDGRGNINQEGLDFYQRLVDRLLEYGIVPCPTLFHWDLPQALEELGGFRNRDTVSWFGDYAALMVRELGDRVHMWSTFNEPWCYAYLGHASGVHAPGLTDPHAAVTVAHHELLAHGLALQTMRAERGDLQLGIVINPSNIVSDAKRPADDAQVRLIDAIHNRWWLDATICGDYPAELLESFGPLADAIHAGDTETISQPLDWIGINYYFDIIVRGLDAGEVTDRMLAYPTVTGVTEADEADVHTDMGWPITPIGFTDLLVRLRDDYPGLPPIYITENGLGAKDPIIDGEVVDDDRIDLQPGELISQRMVRFRTLGCYPLTGAVESEATSLADIIAEMRASTSSERQGRAIDHDGAGSMERKKKEGYF